MFMFRQPPIFGILDFSKGQIFEVLLRSEVLPDTSYGMKICLVDHTRRYSILRNICSDYVFLAETKDKP